MVEYVKIKDKKVGPANPVYVIAEIGINHNGDVELAKKMIKAAKDCGSDTVKFQKRNPDICVPPDQKDKIKETPWGIMNYLIIKNVLNSAKMNLMKLIVVARRLV